MKTSPLFETLEHRVFESQVEDQETPDLPSSKDSRSFEVLSRFRDLPEEEKEIIQIVSEHEGSDSKTIGRKSKSGLSRFQALQKAKQLVNLGILRSTTGTKPKSGAKATLYFFLADDLSREVVELMLNSIALARPGKIVQANPVHRGDSSEAYKQSGGEANGKAKAVPSPRKSRSNNFWMEPPFAEIVKLVNEAPNGIMAKEIEALTGSRKQTLNGWLRELLGAGRVNREIAPGTSPREYRYYPATASLKAVIPLKRTEIKSQDQEMNSDPSPAPNDEARQTEQVVASESPNQQVLPELPLLTQSSEEIDIREILEALIDRVQDLENRFQLIEQTLKGKKTIKSEKIQAFLKRE